VTNLVKHTVVSDVGFPQNRPSVEAGESISSIVGGAEEAIPTISIARSISTASVAAAIAQAGEAAPATAIAVAVAQASTVTQASVVSAAVTHGVRSGELGLLLKARSSV
jgi:hypothetical protein